MVISVAEKVLIAGGMLNLAYGTLLGYPITVIRVKGAPATPKYLMAAHVSALLHAQLSLTIFRSGAPSLGDIPQGSWPLVSYLIDVAAHMPHAGFPDCHARGRWSQSDSDRYRSGP